MDSFADPDPTLPVIATIEPDRLANSKTGVPDANGNEPSNVSVPCRTAKVQEFCAVCSRAFLETEESCRAILSFQSL